MANYSYIGYAPGIITVNITGFNTGTVTLDSSYDPDTDRRVFDVEDAAGGFILNGFGPPVPDTGDVFNGDRFSDENGDDATQTGTITNLDGSTEFLSGDIYLEESYILADPSGGTITVFRVEVEGALGGYITSEPLDPGVTYTMNIVNVTPDNAPDTTDPDAIVDVPCFAAGTLIRTPDGDVAIETLAAGDAVQTLDHGPQRIRWIGARTLTNAELAANPRLRPVVVKAGALGSGLPLRDLKVSPQHRMLVRSSIAVRMFNTQEVLIPANKLVGIPGIAIDASADGVTYYHMLFDRHEIVTAEGAPSESLFTGPEAMKSIGEKARAEIIELFPELDRVDHISASARLIPSKGKRARHMIYRHLKNDTPLIDRI